ncbi:MAG: SDR family oxidoreductase [Pseudobdellovibrionaceae bacterium]
MSLAGQTIVISGGSRGIGRAIALKCAKDKATVALLAKTAEPHPDLEGTIYSVAKEIEALGGTAIPLVCDVRDEEQVAACIENILAKTGRIDALINNASAIFVAGTAETSIKKFDLMQSVNTRGTYVLSQACLPHLLKSPAGGTVLTLSPPVNMAPRWLGMAPAYMLSKYGMSLLTLGFAAEFAGTKLRACCLWPATLIATAAIEVNFEKLYKAARDPAIMADAAHIILTKSDKSFSGKALIDEDVLSSAGITDFTPYEPAEGAAAPDIFLGE